MSDNENQAISTHEPIIRRNIVLIEIAVLLVVAILYGKTLLDLDPTALQQTGEHNEGATLAILAEIAIKQYGEFPLWNPYTMTGLPHTGDPLTQFFNPISALSYIFLGAIPGLRLSILISLFIAGVGQLFLGYVLGFKLPVRLWSALLFMLSGGLVMLWRIGTYGFVVGAVWFPFCIASVIWALSSNRRLPIALAAISIAMLFLSGLMYWSVYFFGCMVLIAIFALVASKMNPTLWGDYRSVIVKLGSITVLTLGLIAIYLLPMTDAWAYMGKESSPDITQGGAQPIPYALINYLTDDFDWYMSGLLGKAPSGTWFYIGVTPLFLLAFVPVAYTKSKQRAFILLMSAILLLLLAWQANPYTPFGLVYKWIPYLYTLRFPHRTLIVAASPLIALAGFGLGYIFDRISSVKFAVGLIPPQEKGKSDIVQSISVSKVIEIGLIILLAFTLRDVYQTNQHFAFDPKKLDANADNAMAWLKEHDPSVYYVNVGNFPIIWGWTPAAYYYEHKLINFEYGRILKSWNHQKDPQTLLRATPKYMFAFPEIAPLPPAEFIRSFNNVNLYRLPDSLPYSFTIAESLVDSETPVTPENVQQVKARLDGTNRIVVEASSTGQDMLLVVLESYYPGWKVYIDGESQPVEPIGDYLGVEAQPGSHTYVFSFEPLKFTWGWIISLLTLIIVILLGLSDRYKAIAEIPARVFPRLSPPKPETEV